MKPAAVSRNAQRRAIIEGRKLFEKALKVGAQVEAGLKAAVNQMPFFARLRVAIQIIMRSWE